jgi:hypothetical protein
VGNDDRGTGGGDGGELLQGLPDPDPDDGDQRTDQQARGTLRSEEGLMARTFKDRRRDELTGRTFYSPIVRGEKIRISEDGRPYQPFGSETLNRRDRKYAKRAAARARRRETFGW